ncbi:MAG: hypothetical protein OEY59_09090 [Deltaproteobacteria bacterium]|nr:hypothetical protein [Deltaproteobacteria bacterium]
MKKNTSKPGYRFGLILFSFYLLLHLTGFVSSDAFALHAPANHRNIFENIRSLYIQTLSGPKKDEFRQIFYSQLLEMEDIPILDLLPEDYDELGILRIKILDYNYWEKEEPIKKNSGRVYSEIERRLYPKSESEEDEDDENDELEIEKKLTKEIKKEEPKREYLIRRNVLITVRFSLFEAKTGRALLSDTFSQPFQQIYVTQSAKENRPTEQEELYRVCSLLIKKILSNLNPEMREQTEYVLENGFGVDWLSRYIYDFGNRRVLKGNRLAESGELNKALWVWKIVLFGPEDDEDETVYLKNRANSYYNIGLVYLQQENWWEAAKMFSQANRITQKLKYAQAWGDSMYSWLQFQKRREFLLRQETLEKEKQEEIEKLVRKKKKEALALIKAKPVEEKIEIIKGLESDDHFMLKPRLLWPFEPLLKNKVPMKQDDLKPQETSKKERLRAIPLEPVDTGE